MISLTNEQKYLIDVLTDWYKSPNSQFITVGGYASTGKTTVISFFRNNLKEIKKDLNVTFCSYTGKATRVLGSKLEEQKTKESNDSVSTIHSLLYSPLTNNKEEIIGWERKRELKTDLIIVDEASMIDSEIWKDLLSFKIPIIAVGDHGQLPPIKGNFNLMQEPILKLEEIHRQARDNPIIKISEIVRKEGEIPVNKWSSSVEKFSRNDPEASSKILDVLESSKSNSLILCGFNTTRVRLNSHIRSMNEIFSNAPIVGDRVICLRNNHEKQIYNGMLGSIVSIEDDKEETYFAKIIMDEGLNYKGVIYAPQFGNKESLNFTDMRAKIGNADLFDFGYAMTVHKAQGSQAKRVVLFEERSSHMDDDMWRRWLYTGITRAEEELFIVGKKRLICNCYRIYFISNLNLINNVKPFNYYSKNSIERR